MCGLLARLPLPCQFYFHFSALFMLIYFCKVVYMTIEFVCCLHLFFLNIPFLKVVFCCDWGCLICLLVLVIVSSILVTLIMLLLPTVVISSISYYCSIIKGPASLYCTTIVNPRSQKVIFLHVHTSSLACYHLFIKAAWLPLLLENNIGGPLRFGSMSLVGLLNSSVAGLGNTGMIHIDLIFNKAMYISVLLCLLF